MCQWFGSQVADGALLVRFRSFCTVVGNRLNDVEVLVRVERCIDVHNVVGAVDRHYGDGCGVNDIESGGETSVDDVAPEVPGDGGRLRDRDLANAAGCRQGAEGAGVGGVDRRVLFGGSLEVAPPLLVEAHERVEGAYGLLVGASLPGGLVAGCEAGPDLGEEAEHGAYGDLAGLLGVGRLDPAADVVSTLPLAEHDRVGQFAGGVHGHGGA